MATQKVTFTLDRDTIVLLENAASRLAIPKSQVVREAILDFHERTGRLGERERLLMLQKFDELMPRIPTRSASAVARELKAVRESRRLSGARRR
jgi:hypothetical protein